MDNPFPNGSCFDRDWAGSVVVCHIEHDVGWQRHAIATTGVGRENWYPEYPEYPEYPGDTAGKRRAVGHAHANAHAGAEPADGAGGYLGRAGA